jgi:hypothetical protein
MSSSAPHNGGPSDPNPPGTAPSTARCQPAQLAAAAFRGASGKRKIMLGTILIIILILLLIGALPSWPYSSGWGYYPSGGLGLVLVIILVLVLMGRV